MKKNPILRNILSAISVGVVGFMLLNLTFILDYLFHLAAEQVFGLFTSGANPENVFPWYSPLIHFLFAVVILFISWLIFRLKIPHLSKAYFLTVPLAVVFVTLGIFLYRSPVTLFIISILITALLVYYLSKTKQPWIYLYTVVLVTSTLGAFYLLGGEI